MAFTPAAFGAYIAAASLGYGVYSGERAAGERRKSLGRQEQAQKQAEASTLSQQRKADAATAKANSKSPDILGILAKQQAAGGLGPTDLSAYRGLDLDRLKLGAAGKLGA